MKVFVTGSLGYIGSVLVPFLRQAGHNVRGTDTGFFASEHHPAFGETLRKDVRMIESGDVKGHDAIVHLAALSNDPMGELDERLTEEINWKASIRLAELAKTAGVRRFIFSSSCSMYGKTKADAATEDDELNPLTAYARSKVSTERDLRPMADEYFSPTYLRNGTVYGDSPALRFDLVLNNLVGSALTTGKIVILSDGTPWRPLVHVEDVCRAILATLEASERVVHNQALNVGRLDGNYQVRDVALAVQRVLPSCEITFGSNQPNPDQRDYRVNFQKIAGTLPTFKPRWTLEEGARQIIDRFRDRHLTAEEFSGPTYVRLQRLKQLLANGILNSELYWASP